MNSINGKTRTLGLIGNPVAHTMSPFIHALLAEAMGINAVYVPFHVEKGALEAAIDGAKALSLLGNNVTVPYKVDVLPLLDVVSENAKMIGAVNTLKYVDGKSFGYNTDVDGLKTSCLKNGIVFEHKTVCILGAGGAAKATVILCAQMKVGKMFIVNRTIEKAFQLQQTVQKYFDLDVEVITYEELTSIEKLDICFQTTSIGLHPNSNISPILSPSFFNKVEWAVDAIYNPSETKFLRDAKAHGAHTLNGLGMLFYQAIKAFELWHDVVIPDAIQKVSFQKFNDFVYNR